MKITTLDGIFSILYKSVDENEDLAIGKLFWFINIMLLSYGSLQLSLSSKSVDHVGDG